LDPLGFRLLAQAAGGVVDGVQVIYRGTSLIRKRPHPQDHLRAQGIGLL